MGLTAAELFIEKILDWDVHVLFGVPGHGADGLLAALDARQKRVQFVRTADAKGAAYMAAGYARGGGRLGVVLVPSDSGIFDILGDPGLDGQSLLILTGSWGIGHEFCRSCWSSLAFDSHLLDPDEADHVADSACRAALAFRKKVHVEFPLDLQGTRVNRRADKPATCSIDERYIHGLDPWAGLPF